MERGGTVTYDANSPRASYSSKILQSWDVFQNRAEVRDTFSDVFELLRYTDEPFANGQDVLVLRKPIASQSAMSATNLPLAPSGNEPYKPSRH